MDLKVIKFGGSSLADAEHFKNAAKIVRDDSARKYVVVSAPGKRSADDTKITDMLLQSLGSTDCDSIIDMVAQRFQEIIHQLGLSLPLEDDIAAMKNASRLGQRDYLISRGEHISAKIMAALLNFDFIDAKDGIHFEAPYVCDWNATRKSIGKLLSQSSHAVIPGFYGSDPDGNICTFLRGGSDITGSIVADAMGADLYENFTDVSGVLAVDPHIIPNPSPIQILSYDELRTFAHLGAEVIHEDAIRPCQRSGIPIVIKNSNKPWEEGTLITTGHRNSALCPVAVGVKKGLGMISISYADSDLEKQSQIVTYLSSTGMAIEHMSVTEDRITLIVSNAELKSREHKLRAAIIQLERTCKVTIKHNLVLLGVIGRFPHRSRSVIHSISQSLSKAGIAIDLLEKGYGDPCVVAVVRKSDRIKAVNTIYNEIIQNLEHAPSTLSAL